MIFNLARNKFEVTFEKNDQVIRSQIHSAYLLFKE